MSPSGAHNVLNTLTAERLRTKDQLSGESQGS